MPPLEVLFSIQTLLFLTFALGAVATAVALVLHPNPLRAGLFLVLNLFCVAVLYLLLNAYFLAAVQVIVYAGAIMVLFLFVIMLLNLGTPDRTADRLKWQTPAAVIAGLALASVFGGAVFFSVPYNAPAATPLILNQTERTQKSADQAARSGKVQAGPAQASAGGSGGSGGAGQEKGAEAASDPEASPEVPTAPPDTMGTVEGVGRVLYDPAAPWLFPFEMTSILLLIAVVGSVVLAKRRIPGDDANVGAEGKI